MTPTQIILRNFILCSIGGISIFACSEPLKEDGDYCFNIEEGETCPDLDTINSDYLPEEPVCSTIEYVEATAGPTQDDVPITGMEEIDASEMDSCCYTASYRQIRDEAECVIGRPLMQNGSATVASVRLAEQEKNPWSQRFLEFQKPIEIQNLSKEQREVAGTFYLTTALYEHASIASFQKFSLDLMRFGAPPHLLDLAQQATRDEIRHAQLAFSIAEEILEKTVQPSQLDYTPILCSDIKELARTTLQEGAIGETLAVLLAGEQLRVTKDPHIKAFLQTVVEDESKHAELAWETLRWCLEQDSSVREILEEAIRKGPQISISHYPEAAILEMGLPDRETLHQLLQRGFERVILPSIQSLLQQAA